MAAQAPEGYAAADLAAVGLCSPQRPERGYGPVPAAAVERSPVTHPRRSPNRPQSLLPHQHQRVQLPPDPAFSQRFVSGQLEGYASCSVAECARPSTDPHTCNSPLRTTPSPARSPLQPQPLPSTNARTPLAQSHFGKQPTHTNTNTTRQQPERRGPSAPLFVSQGQSLGQVQGFAGAGASTGAAQSSAAHLNVPLARSMTLPSASTFVAPLARSASLPHDGCGSGYSSGSGSSGASVAAMASLGYAHATAQLQAQAHVQAQAHAQPQAHAHAQAHAQAQSHGPAQAQAAAAIATGAGGMFHAACAAAASTARTGPGTLQRAATLDHLPTGAGNCPTSSNGRCVTEPASDEPLPHASAEPPTAPVRAHSWSAWEAQARARHITGQDSAKQQQQLQRSPTLVWHPTGFKLSDLPDATQLEYEYQYTVTGRTRKRKNGPRPGKRAVIQDIPVALFRFGDQLFAVSAKCAHQGGPLHMGDIEEIGDHGPCVECPWHRWTFSLRTGASVAPSGHSVPTFPVRVEHDASLSVGFSSFSQTIFQSEDF